MADIFKIARCDHCQHQKEIPPPAKDGRDWCPKCGADIMRFVSENWYVRKYGQKKVVSSRLKDAQAELAAIIKNHTEGRSILNRVKTVGWDDAVDSLLKFSASRNKSRTAEFYKGHLKILGDYFKKHGIKTLNQITVHDFDAFVSWRMKQGVGEVSVNRDAAALRRLFSYCHERKLLSLVVENPIKEWEFFPETGRARVLTPAEEEALLAACKEKGRSRLLYPMVLTARDTGLRKIDIIRLRREEVDFEGGFIRKEALGKQRKGREHAVAIPMTPRLHAVLSVWCKKCGDSAWVFPSTANPKAPIRATSRIGFETAVQKAGLTDVTFHDLRRTFATRWAEAGGCQKTLQLIMDHSTIAITAKIYMRVSEEHMAREMSRVTGNTESQHAANG